MVNKFRETLDAKISPKNCVVHRWNYDDNINSSKRCYLHCVKRLLFAIVLIRLIFDDTKHTCFKHSISIFDDRRRADGAIAVYVRRIARKSVGGGRRPLPKTGCDII